MTQSTNLKLDLLSATDLFDTDKIKSNFEKIDNTVLIPTKIIDNCVTDNSLLPLSAKQGKLLQDQITKLNGDLTDHIRYENVSVTIPVSARYIDVPLSYICNYVRSVLPVNGDGLIIVQSSRLESKKVRIYVVASETERRSTVCIGYS